MVIYMLLSFYRSETNINLYPRFAFLNDNFPALAVSQSRGSEHGVVENPDCESLSSSAYKHE